MPSILRTIVIVALILGAYEAAAFYLGYDYSIYSIYQKTQQTETTIEIIDVHYFTNGTAIPENYIINLDSGTPSVIVSITVTVDAPVRISSAKYAFTVGTQSAGDLQTPIDSVALGISHTWTDTFRLNYELDQDEYPVFAGTYLAGFAVNLYTPEGYLLMQDIYHVSIVSS